MKNYIATLTLLFSLAFSFTQCSKGGGDDKDPCSEAAISVSTTPAINTTEPPASGTTFNLKVNITGGFPVAGANIEIKAHPEGNNNPYFATSVSGVAGNNNIDITGTPTGVVCVVEITVVSKSCNTNKWTGSYRYSRK